MMTRIKWALHESEKYGTYIKLRVPFLLEYPLHDAESLDGGCVIAKVTQYWEDAGIVYFVVAGRRQQTFAFSLSYIEDAVPYAQGDGHQHWWRDKKEQRWEPPWDNIVKWECSRCRTTSDTCPSDGELSPELRHIVAEARELLGDIH